MRWLVLGLLLVLTTAQAQVVRSFSARYQGNEQGNVLLIGNTLMCAGSGSSCDTGEMNDSSANNAQNMIFVNADGAAPSWPNGKNGSSAATLQLPSGAQVLFAGLYWGARAASNNNTRNTISVKPPGRSSYQSVSGSLLGTITAQGTNTTRPYSAFADLTSLVQASGSGTYWVGGITAATGNDGLGFYAGWSLVVVYRDITQPLRNLVVYDGLATVSSGNNVTITPSGFLTPAVGAVQASLGAVVFEGDAGISGDQLILNGTALSDAQNPNNNFFNSSVSRLGNRTSSKTPDYVNQMGVDVDLVDATGRIPNGATSATIQFTSSQDTYFPTVLTFVVDLYLPDLITTFSKTVQDVNGGSVVVGDVLEYTLSFTNTGQDGATNVVVTDPIPAHTVYVPNSLQVVNNAGASTGNMTDAAGDDIAEFDDANNRVRFRLGSGANASQGGLVLPGQSTMVRFRVQVQPSGTGQTIQNTAQVNYTAQTLGQNFSQQASTSVSTPVAGASVSGTVYHDLQPNSLREPGEAWDGPTVYLKLIQGGSVVAQQALTPGPGNFTFSNVPPGNYTLILDDNPGGDTTPTPPTGWLFIEPVAGSRSLSVGGSNVSGQDFGLYHGSRISGTVFRDDGLGSGTANDALQNGGEPGIAGVAVTASDGAQSRSAVTDSLGNYVLYVPYTFGPALTLSHPLAPATGSNVGGSSAVLATAYGQSAAQQRTISPFAPGNRYDGYNFGVVRPSLWQPDQSGQASSPGVVTYAHRVRPGTLGTLTFLRLAGGWNYLLRLDANCDGDFADAGEGYQGLPYSLAVGSAWPREADGSLRACAVEVMVIVPAGLPGGSSDFLNLASRLRYAGNAAVDDQLALTDTTVVGAGGELRLTKQVQNLTQGTPPSTGRADGRPGEVLEYCIAYQNQSASPVTQVVLTDPIPFFTDYQAGTLRLDASPLTDAADADAGEVSGGLVRVRIGTLAAGAGGQVCYRVKIR
ncbi:MAG: hypothetical protein C4333_01525 [Meiothermus sp.]